jgi:hypothetical protein
LKKHFYLNRFWALIGILAIGFFARGVGAPFGLPHLYHADEPIVVNHALAYGSGDFNPHFFKIPPLVSYLLFIAYGIFYVAGHAAGKFSSPHDFEIFFYSDPSAFYLIARIVFGVVLGTISIYALYHLVRKYFSESAAVLSALFLATNFLHVKDSHYIYADIPLVLILILSFSCFFRILRKGDTAKAYILAGISIGLATATKYNGIILAVPFLYVAFFPRRKIRFELILLAAFCGALTYAPLNPFSIINFPFFIQDAREQAQAQSGVSLLHHLDYSLIGGLGLPVFVLAIAGMVLAARQARDHRRNAMIAFIFVYYLVLVRYAQPYDRYALPLIPFFIFFAADFVTRTQTFFQSKALFAALIIASLIPPISKVVLFDLIMREKDTRTIAKEWVEENIPSGSAIAMAGDFYLPRLQFSKDQLEDKKREASKIGTFSAAQIRRLEYFLTQNPKAAYKLHFLVTDPSANRFLFAQPTLPYDLGTLKERGIQYIILADLKEYESIEFYNRVKSEARLLKRFSPYRNQDRAYPVEDILTGGPFLFKDLWQRKRNGQPLSVYQIN